MNLGLGTTIQGLLFSTSSSHDINIINSPSTKIEFDTSKFIVPTSSNGENDALSFGSITLSQLRDNNLAICVDGKTQCGSAVIRMYTTDAAGAGLWNTAGGYGAPLKAGQSTMGTVGLGTAGALGVQTVTLTSNIHVLHLKQFTDPTYQIETDMSNAGAGTYTTTLVIEYILKP